MKTKKHGDKKPPLTKTQRRRQRCRNCSFSLGLWLLFGLAVSKIIMGAEFGCSLDNKVIVYLVVSGSVILLITVVFIAFIIAFGADTMFSKKMKKMMRVPIIVCLIHLPWLIVGSVWGFRNLKDVLDGCDGDCCNKVLVFFAVSTIVVDWLLTIATIISIHYMDISRKKIMSLFFDEPPVFVDVGTQHDTMETDDEKTIKNPPTFEEIVCSPVSDETHIKTGKRGILSVQDTLHNDVTCTPVETLNLVSEQLSVQPKPDTLQTVGAANSDKGPSAISYLPNSADFNTEIKCDLLPISTDDGTAVSTKKSAASSQQTVTDSKSTGNNKSKAKSKKHKK